MAAAKVKTLAEQKQDLIARGDLYRRALANDLQQIQAAVGWVPKTLSLVRTVSPLLVLSGPLAAWLFRGRRKNKVATNGEPGKEKVSTLARIWGAIRIAQQAVPFVHGFMQAWPRTRGPSKRTTESAPSSYRP
ncbi:MAG TPA: hypothetical protein VK850_13860 [Candidatus Binatia bacterium]|nr:hypothetical protein [Candidatus Binatia bacterium]